MKEKLFTRLPAAVILAAVLFAEVRAGAAAQLQLVVAVPDPIVAGEELTVQAIIFNSGSETWQTNDYSAEVEIYDSAKSYVTKTARKKGTQTIKPSEAALFYVPFAVPASFSGSYFYKVYLVYKEQRIAESDFNGFNVVALPSVRREPSALELGGNAFIYFKNTSKYDWADYAGNFNLNLIGAVKKKPLMFNLYTFHTPKSTAAPSNVNHEIYTIFFSYYADGWSAALGDILPAFSPLSLYGAGMRGGTFDVKSGGFAATGVVARSVAPTEGTASTNGAYERIIGGARGEYEFIPEISAGASYLYGFDRRESVAVPGPSLTPASNSVAGGTLKIRPTEDIGLTVEYQQSDYRGDVDASTAPAAGTAYRVEMKYSPKDFTARGSYQVAGADFYTFGSPGATKDRKTMDFYTAATVFSKVNLSAGYTNYRDNTKDDPSKVTTNQNIYTGALSLAMSGAVPSPSVSYSLNEAYASPPNRSALDNVTNGAALGLTGRLSGVSYSLSAQRSDFADKNKTADDLRSDTFSSALSFQATKRILANLGVTLSATDNLVKKTKTDTTSLSGAVNYTVVPDRLMSQIWGGVTSKKNPADPLDSSDTSANMEFTYQFSGALAWTLGGSVTQYRDNIALTSSAEHGFNTRLSYSF